jgi:hypothetical protein
MDAAIGRLPKMAQAFGTSRRFISNTLIGTQSVSLAQFRIGSFCTGPQAQAVDVSMDPTNIVTMTLNRPKQHNVFSDLVIAELNDKFNLLRKEEGMGAFTLDFYDMYQKFGGWCFKRVVKVFAQVLT